MAGEKREAAQDRQREGGRAGGEGSGKFPEASRAQSKDKLAAAVGVDRKTLEKARHSGSSRGNSPEAERRAGLHGACCVGTGESHRGTVSVPSLAGRLVDFGTGAGVW
jgi:hypothetical protein